MKTQIALTKCRDYRQEDVDFAVNRVIELLGGIENIIKPKSKVLIKPNLLSDRTPDECITTHPLVIESVIRLVKKTNAEIFVGDSPSVIGETKAVDEVYEATGMKEVCQRQDVQLVYFDKTILKNGIPITDWIDNCDYLINVPKFKTHTLTMLTGAVKNSFGLVCGMHKAKLHRDCLEVSEFSKRLVDVFQAAKPALNIVDGVISLEGDGPGTTGIKTNTGFIMAGTDAVAIDSVLAIIMGVLPYDIPTTKEAASRNLGESEIEKIEILGENLYEFVKDGFRLPNTSRLYKMPKLLRKAAKQLVWYKMQVVRQNCQSCGRCIEICPVKTIDYKQKKAYIDTKNCILCSCCQEVCPYKAVTLKKSLLLRLLGV